MVVPVDEARRMEEVLTRYLRLYHHPVAVFFRDSGQEIESLLESVSALVPKNKISFCQALAFAREVGGILRLNAAKLACVTAADIFGFSVQRDKAVKALASYLGTEEAERFYDVRPRLELGAEGGVVLSSLEMAPEIPDAVIMVVDALQAMHLLDFYAGATLTSEVSLSHNVNGSACANTVKALMKGGPQLALPCPGAFTSGKMERGELILAFPWEAFLQTFAFMEKRARKGHVSLLGGATLVGNDVCRNCPFIKFEQS